MHKILITILTTLMSFSVANAQAEADITQPLRAAADELVVNCRVDRLDNETYAGSIVSVEAPEKVKPNELFPVKIRIKNIGSMPWISSTSGCESDTPMYLGTSRNQDRQSPFHAPGVFGTTGWYQGNRIKMKTPRVDTGDIAEYTFTAKAPSNPGLYREYFQPVVEHVTWVDTYATFDVQVGEPELNEDILKYTREIPLSINLLDPKFVGKKSITIDISDQRMSLKLGSMEVKNFPVSSGTWRTPTPFGTTYISLKQDVRVGSAWPHYIMPKFMMFRKGGYGIHALPSIRYDGGRFWSEALNHIGTRRSHGCIRLLPDDAVFAYNFAEIGTPVHVVP